MNSRNADSIAAEPLREQLAYLARTASVELNTREIIETQAYLRMLAPATRVYVPHLPSTGAADLQGAVASLVRHDLVPVVHLAARRIRSNADLENRLDAITDHGCRDVLLVGGGVSSPVGPYASSSDVLETGKLDEAGIRRVGFAGHPEGSPDVPDDVLIAALRDKARFCEGRPYHVYAVSQFAFSAKTIIAWEQRIRDIGLPIHVGIPGITTTARLLRFAAICGVTASVGFARRGTTPLGKVLGGWTPAEMVLQLAKRVASDSASMIRHLHFFPFGGFPATISWLNGIAAGSFELRDDSNRLVIDEDAG